MTFKADYPNLISANVCSCTIENGKTVTLSSANTLSLEFDYSGSGILILEDSASLYQSDDEMVNTGIVHVKRKSSPILKFDFTYWSSPVQNQKLIDVSPDTLWDKYFSFDYQSGNWKDENSSNKMTPGKGYIIRGPQDFSTNIPSQFEATFKGIPNNGKIDLDVGMDTSNLIGNPYPSAISADLFLLGNKLNLKGALYFWTHNTPYNFSEYSSNDYAVYNLLGGVGTRSSVSAGINETIPDGTIASGQAFFVESKNSGNAEFNNSMRIKNKNSSFFKPSKNAKSKNINQIEKHRIWLNFENKQGAFKQILFGYIQGATNLYDENYDAQSFNGNQYVDFYSIADHKNLVIQGRALPFINTDVVPLGYQTKIAGEFTISIDNIDGNMSNQPIYIEDKTTGISHNLQSSNYTFTTIAGTFEDRFIIKYTDKTLETKDFENLENGILVSVKNKVINIKSSKENIKEVTVFDITGKLLYNKKKLNTTELQIQNLPVNNQVLLVNVTLENDFKAKRKILF